MKLTEENLEKSEIKMRVGNIRNFNRLETT